VSPFDHRAEQRAATLDERLENALPSEQGERSIEIDTPAAPGPTASTFAPAARHASTEPARACSVVTTSVGPSAMSNSGPSAGTRPRPSNSTRNGVRAGATRTSRTVSAGRSASAVPDPTTTACESARSSCASARASSDVIHCDVPSAAATRPSRLSATFATTNARPVRR
jgi:hypothetical protein